MEKLLPEAYSDLNTITVFKDGVLTVVDIHTGLPLQESIEASFKDALRYTPPLGSIICDYIREGKSFAEIALLPNMPRYAAIMRWRHVHNDFAEAIKRAKKDRAELYHDRVIALAEGIEDEEGAKIAKVKMDAYKWATEKNSEDYNKGDPKQQNSGVTFIINTGVPQAVPVTIEVQSGREAESPAEERSEPDSLPCIEGDQLRDIP